MSEQDDPGSPPSEAIRPKRRWQRWRLLLVAVLFAGLYIAGSMTGVIDELDPDEVRARVSEAGPWGVLVYVGVFSVGELLHVPGVVFVAAGILAYGRAVGFAVALLGSVVSVSVSFVIVRTVGGKALGGVDRPLMRKMLDRLHARPIITIALLRAVFWMSPPLNYALALTNVRFRDYLIGSAAGLVVPVLALALFFDVLFR